MLTLDRTNFQTNFMNFFAALKVLCINTSKFAVALVMNVSAYPYQ